ncbi:MAG: hypothetical protein O3A00_11870 [Planctomycetota bacterium]|nr:hypothetical protein [Planctomycetota bacterium]
MAKLDERVEFNIASRIAVLLSQRFEDAAAMAHQNLRDEIRQLFPQAKHYELESERSLATFATSAWLFGRNFDVEFPEANAILKRNESCDDKVNALREWAETQFSNL